jgi:hypothetical protein
MNHISKLAAAAVALVALGTGCDKGGSDSLIITGYDVTCSGDKVTFSVQTDGGEAKDGLVFTQETANATPQYSDEHDVLSTGPDALKLTIDAGVAFDDAVRNEGTVFSCDQHFNSPGQVLTYAFGVYGDGGAIVDCLVGGHDPQGLKNGDYGDRINEPSGEFDLGKCVVAQ